MKYVFGFELDYKRYRKDFRCVIHIDHMMLDDLILQNSQKILKFYTIDIDTIKTITIDNTCEDSNYVNGFITKSAEYSFNKFLFVPLHLFNHRFFDTLQKKRYAIKCRKYPGYMDIPDDHEPEELTKILEHCESWPVVFKAKRMKLKSKNIWNHYVHQFRLNESTTLYMDIIKKHGIFMSLPRKQHGYLHVGKWQVAKWINMYNENQ